MRGEWGVDCLCRWGATRPRPCLSRDKFHVQRCMYNVKRERLIKHSRKTKHKRQDEKVMSTMPYTTPLRRRRTRAKNPEAASPTSYKRRNPHQRSDQHPEREPTEPHPNPGITWSDSKENKNQKAWKANKRCPNGNNHVLPPLLGAAKHG